jgi:hypothetical protein
VSKSALALARHFAKRTTAERSARDERGAGKRPKPGIMIYGPRNDGTYIVEFKTADGEALAINVPVGETRVLKHFQERMPYGLFVPDVDVA